MSSNDKKINNFLILEEEFANNITDIDTSIDPYSNDELEINEIEGDELNRFNTTKFTKLDLENLEKVVIDEIISEETEVINLKDNFLPKGLTPLEYLFDSNDVLKKNKMEPVRSDINECKIGTSENPKLMKLSK